MSDAMHAEWTKLRTIPGTIWLLAATVVLTIGLSALAVAATRCRPAIACSADTTKLSLTGIQSGQVTVVIMAAAVVSAEYSTGMISITLIAMPRREIVLAAKSFVVTGLVMGAGLIAVLGSVLTGRLILPINGFTATRGFTPLSLGDGAVLRASAGSVLYLALIALLSLGIALVVRDSAAAIGTVLGLLYLFPIAAHLVDLQWYRRLEQIGPMTAGLAIQATSGLPNLPISPWDGLGVLAAWAAAALLVGGLLFRLRDA